MINVANLKLYFLYPGTRVSTTSVNNSDDSIASLPPRVHGDDEQVPRGTLYNLIDIPGGG